MAKFNFTPDGVQLATQYFYGLPDLELLSQAQACAQDFKSWLQINFALNQDQVAYLNAMDPMTAGNFGCAIAAAATGREPINIDPPVAEATKKTTVGGSVSGTYNPATGGSTYTGTLSGSFTWP